MKLPFDIPAMFRLIESAVAELPRAALFELAEEGYDSAFQQLVACILSIRTRDEVMLPTARNLLARAGTPARILEMGEEELDGRIRACTFHGAKARQILQMAREVEERYGGQVPCSEEVLLAFAGVGPKCAHLVLGIACGEPWIGVDIHVHRITNRWGYVAARTPEQTMRQLEERLPKRYWVEINRLLVPFGKHVCTGRLPHCSTCPVLEYCQQVGVEAHR